MRSASSWRLAAVSADRTGSELKALFDTHDWFKLRDAIGRSVGAPAFYRGAVACASGEREPATYGFDSGMDISFISETEANRLRVPIHGVSAASLQDGASGNAVPIRFVIADRLNCRRR
jgi:hypothetical protein